MKNLIVFGASGGTGKKVVELGLEKGYHITAVVRNPKAFSLRHENLSIIRSDVLSPITFKNELKGQEAVISCLGIPKIQETTLYSRGMQNIISAMEDAGIKRILCISSGALDIPYGSSFIMKFLLKNVLQRLYKPIYSDMRLMEGMLINSDLDWTIVRAPKLTDGRKTDRYKDITNQPLNGIPKISRADLADFMLKQLTNKVLFKKRVDIAY